MKTSYFTFYGDISDISARYVMHDINAAIVNGADEISIFMASNGGSTRSGFVIYNFLRGVNANISIHNLGHVDSASFCMFLAGDVRTASPISTFNIHRPSNNLPKEVSYNSYFLGEQARLLDNDEENIISIYTERTKMSAVQVLEFLLRGAVFKPNEAVELGIISNIQIFNPPAGVTIPPNWVVMVFASMNIQTFTWLSA